jgi:zinc protease
MITRTKARILVLVSLVLSALSLASAQQQAARVPQAAQDPKTAALDQLLPLAQEVAVEKLPNGLSYCVRVNKQPLNRVELRLVVNAGSVLEDADQQGLAHFTEHMAFNGTAHFAKNELIRFMESIGMRMGPSVNAYTGLDETVYMLTVPTDKPDVMEKAFLILEDWAHNLSFDPAEIDKERGVIVEEWRLGRGAGARIQDKQLPILLKGSRYAERMPIGKKEVIETFKHDTLKRFYRDWYRPDLMAVVAVGDVDGPAIEALIKRHFGPLQNPRNERPRSLYQVPDHPGTLYAIATDKEMTTTSVSVYSKIPVRDQSTVRSYRDKIVERLYFGMLNYRMSDLTQKADPPFVMSAAGRGRFVKSKEAVTLGALVRDGGVERGLDAVLTETSRVARFGFTATELERQKRELMRNRENLFAERDKRESASLAAEYIRHFTQDESIPGSAFEYALHQRFVPEITLEEVNRLASAWGGDSSRVVLVSGPQKEGITVPDEVKLAAVIKGIAAKKLDAYVDSVANASLLDAPPKGGTVTRTATKEAYGVTEWELSNGVRVILKPTDFKADEIRFRASSFGGNSLAADRDFNAIRSADQVISLGGLGRFNAIELRKALAGKTASASPTISETEEGLSGGGSPRDIETLFQLIFMTFTQPRADAEAFAAFKAQMKARLPNQQASPSFAFADAMQKTMTQDHPRGRMMTAELVDELDLDKSLAFYKDRFADASDFTFVFVGTFDLATIKPLVEQYLGGLPSTRRIETWKDAGIRPPRGVVQKTVMKGLEPKSQAGIVFNGPFQYDPQHRVVIRALSDIVSTRLRDLVREELGGTYSIGAGASYTRVPEQMYSIRIQWGCNPDRVGELVKAVLADLADIRAKGPTEKQVNDAREQLLRDFETNIKQNNYLVTQIYFKYLYGEDLETFFGMPESYRKLTPAVIQEAAIAYLSPENYVQVTLLPEPQAAPKLKDLAAALLWQALYWPQPARAF